MSSLLEYLRANSQVAAVLEDPTLEDLLSLAPAPFDTCVYLLNKFRLFTEEQPKYSNCVIDGNLPYDSLIGLSNADLETLGHLVDYLILPSAYLQEIIDCGTACEKYELPEYSKYRGRRVTFNPKDTDHWACIGDKRGFEHAVAAGVVVSDLVCNAAARGGQLEFLQWLTTKGYKPSLHTATIAAETGHFEMLPWLHEQNFPFDEEVFTFVAATGRLDLLQWLYTIKAPLGEGAYAATATNGHLECLQWLVTKQSPEDYWERITLEAAFHGHLELLKWSHKAGAPLNSWVCAHAAKGGHLDILKWAYEAGAPLDDQAVVYAAYAGHIDILNWLVKQGMSLKNPEACEYAAQEGHLETLQWLHESGAEWNTNTIDAAVQNDRFDCFKYAIDNGCPHTNGTIASIAQTCNGDMLKYLYAARDNIVLSLDVSNIVVTRGYLEIAKWLHENGGIFNEQTCERAARGDHVQCLEWLRSIGTPWNEKVCDVAMHNESFNCFKYAIENGAPLNIRHYELMSYGKIREWYEEWKKAHLAT